MVRVMYAAWELGTFVLRNADIKINTWSPLYVNLRINLIFIQYLACNEEINHWSSNVPAVDMEIKRSNTKVPRLWKLERNTYTLNKNILPEQWPQ